MHERPEDPLAHDPHPHPQTTNAANDVQRVGRQLQPDQSDDAPVTDFAPTVADDENAARREPMWPEASDGKCSESAALFAASQPAPLTIV